MRRVQLTQQKRFFVWHRYGEHFYRSAVSRPGSENFCGLNVKQIAQTAGGFLACLSCEISHPAGGDGDIGWEMVRGAHDNSNIDDMESYYNKLMDGVAQRVKQGKSLVEIKKELKIPGTEDWKGKDRFGQQYRSGVSRGHGQISGY